MRTTLLLLLVTLLARTAHADLVWSDAYKNPFSSWGAYMYDQNVKRHLYGRATETTPATQRVAMSATDFRRNSKRADVVAQLVASRPLGRADADALATALRTTMAKLATAGRKDNVASAMAVAIALSYLVLEKHDFDGEKADQLAPAINDLLAASPQFTKLGAAERQHMHDSLLLTSAIIVTLANAGELEASKNVARQLLQNLLATN